MTTEKASNSSCRMGVLVGWRSPCEFSFLARPAFVVAAPDAPRSVPIHLASFRSRSCVPIVTEVREGAVRVQVLFDCLCSPFWREIEVGREAGSTLCVRLFLQGRGIRN